ncbi:MAG: DUF2157 domain-containing protein [Betaproteobacteria bacterium]|nr:DUF2157 domain-containing protein [Betaproteobacteria bacterium]
MTLSSRTDAQRRADEIRVFQHELERLERDGVLALTEAQRKAVADHHAGLLAQFARDFDIDRDVQAKQLSLGMRIASFLGALALAASVFFLFYQFWGQFTEAVQVTILLGAVLGTFLATVWIQGRDASGYFTKLAAMVAFVCFVLNVAMLGQIFNITPSDKALIPWAALAFLLAYACDLRLLLAAGILCVIAFVSARTGTWSGMYWIYFGLRPENFFPAAVALFLVPSFISHRRFPGFAAIYRVFGLLTLFLPVLVLAHWGDASYLDLDPDFIEGFYQVCGFGLSAAAIWLGARQGWPGVVNTALVMFVIFLYSKFFDWWWEIMPKYLFFLVLGIASVLLILVLRRLRARGLGVTGGRAP